MVKLLDCYKQYLHVSLDMRGWCLKIHVLINLFLLTDEDPAGLVSSSRMKVDDFEMVKCIGRGAFGEVQLVRALQDNIILLSEY